MRKDGVRISTNAIEGLFARVKRLLRRYRAAPAKQACFAITVAVEFLGG